MRIIQARIKRSLRSPVPRWDWTGLFLKLLAMLPMPQFGSVPVRQQFQLAMLGKVFSRRREILLPSGLDLSQNRQVLTLLLGKLTIKFPSTGIFPSIKGLDLGITDLQRSLAVWYLKKYR